MSEEQNLKKKVKQLEDELQQTKAELLSYRHQIKKTNTQLEKMMGQISFELTMATQIQKILSPTEMPHIPGFDFSTKFLPGTEKGGDYFDLFEHENKLKFGVIMVCCSGYAMSALFLSLLIKISSRLEARQGLEPHQMVQALAQEIIPQIQGADKASLFYGIVDKRNYELKYCSVGQIEAYLQVYGQDSMAQLEACGPRISKDFTVSPKTLSLQLNPRDRLVIASEGLTSAVNSKNETYGAERLRESIRNAPRTGPHNLRNEVFYQVEQFSGKSEPSRDSTVLVLEVKDRVIKLAQ